MTPGSENFFDHVLKKSPHYIAQHFEAYGLDGTQGAAWSAKGEYKDIKAVVVNRIQASLGKSDPNLILIFNV